MATNLRKAVGQFAAVTSGTTQNVTTTDPTTGLSFQPKVVIVFGSAGIIGSNGTNTTEAIWTLGWSNDNAIANLNVAWEGDGGVGTTNCASDQTEVQCIQIGTNGNGTSADGLFTLTATGFTVTWSTTMPSAYLFNYIALGGSDLDSVAVGSDTMPTATGNRAVSGLGFQPNFVMLLATSNTGIGTQSSARYSYGCAISSSARFAQSLAVADLQNMSASVNGVSIHRSDACMVGINTSAAVDFVADFVSMDAGGFTLNWSDAAPFAYKYYYLAIGGANLQWDISTAAKPTTAIAQSRTGLAFQPEVVLWSNSDLTTLNSITSNAVSMLGATDGTTTQSLYTTHNDAINTVAATKMDTAAVQDGVPAGSSVEASFTSFNSDGWTITWGGTGAANQISSVSLAGTTAVASFTPDEDYQPLLSSPPIDPDITVWQSPSRSDSHTLQCQ